MDDQRTGLDPNFKHKPVLVAEVLEYLNIRPGKTYLDVTFGSGGHSRAILEKEPECKVIAMDWDTLTFDTHVPAFEQEFGDRFLPIWGNFAHLYKILKKNGVKAVDGILADFGTSQMQIEFRPGFSVHNDKPLDMRMSPSNQKITAQEILNNFSEKELLTIFFEYGEERHSKRIVHAILEDRDKHRYLKTTAQLASLIERIVPRAPGRKGMHPATRVFQALRIYINREIENIHAFLPVALQTLAPQGRLVCISFHSLEDRIVKQFFKAQQDAGTGTTITKKVVIPTEEEIFQNRASRSSKLRAFEKI
jgi:16S rRNA (cytosine1402-N4)-methyltransferase